MSAETTTTAAEAPQTDDTDTAGTEEAAALLLKRDQEAKKSLLLTTIASLCTESSEFEDIRRIAEALKNGADRLRCDVLSGGLTNYAYKVYLEGTPDGVALFAKVCFPYALWNPDRTVLYDLKRVENEFATMKQFAGLMGGGGDAAPPVATPYFCVDAEDVKVLVCQWSNADEQWANQFIDGCVDRRIIPKYAEALATLNCCEEFDPMFNDNVRPSIYSMFPYIRHLMKQRLFHQCDSNSVDDDKCVAYCRELGEARLSATVDASENDFGKREMLCHSDTHAFNVLVERKPDPATLERFGETGAFVLVDYEMAFAGPIGRDLGVFLAWPIVCALYHAALGHAPEARHLLDCTLGFSKAYSEAMADKGGKSPEFLCEQFRNALGATYIMLFACFYLLGLQEDLLPWEGIPPSERARIKTSVGCIGVRLGEYGFLDKEPGLTLDQLRTRYQELIENEIRFLLQLVAGRRSRPRRASMLRASGRRVSDAGAMEEAASKLLAHGLLSSED